MTTQRLPVSRGGELNADAQQVEHSKVTEFPAPATSERNKEEEEAKLLAEALASRAWSLLH